ncbi:MAG: alpha/beta fold hydrolase [Halodesulfurarchaeum sp.]
METVTHHDRRTAYRVEDRADGGPTLLFVHGSGGTHEIWKSQFARLSREYPVVGLDLSGHGESDDVETEPGPDTMAAYVADTLAVAEAVDARVLVGNSLGGAVVMTAVLETDPDLDGIVLAGSGAKLAVLEDLRNWLADDFDRAVAFLHGDDMLFHDPEEDLLEHSRSAMRAVGQRVTRRDFLTSHHFDERDRIGQLSLPTLALTGEHDQLTPPWYHEFLASELQTASWTTIPDAAHLSMLEQPAAFNDELREFLAGL